VLLVGLSLWDIGRVGADFNLLHLQARGTESVVWEQKIFESTNHWTLGLMGALQVKFNVANLIVLPLIMAPAVEGGIMIVSRYREESSKARRPSPLPWSTGRAVVFSSLPTIVGFGSLW
jgi:hypothetical protein